MLHRAAFLAKRLTSVDGGLAGGPPILLTTFTTNLAETLDSQPTSLLPSAKARGRVDLLRAMGPTTANVSSTSPGRFCPRAERPGSVIQPS